MRKFGKYIAFAVVLMYFLLGMLLIFNPQTIIFHRQFYLGDVQKELRIIVGIILVLYGIYRMAKIVSTRKKANTTEEV